MTSLNFRSRPVMIPRRNMTHALSYGYDTRANGDTTYMTSRVKTNWRHAAHVSRGSTSGFMDDFKLPARFDAGSNL